MADERVVAVPRLSLLALTARFLRFGLLAWGGPVAQIAMLRSSLVDAERWISSDRFNRTLAVYQVLPGPEAQELCIFFGMAARGRLGGFLAGLAFLLPGFVLMLGLSWFYVEIGIDSPLFAAVFAGCQAAVIAIIVRGVHRLADRSLRDEWLWMIAAGALLATLAGAHFVIPLAAGGLTYLARNWGHSTLAAVVLATMLIGVAGLAMTSGRFAELGVGAAPDARPVSAARADADDMLATGLKAGALTFGGAYTAIPFVQNDAVREHGWVTNRQFLDGLALSGIIPAPLIIFATFVGYVAGGPLGAVAISVGIFAPAFVITMLGHRYLEAAVDNPRLHAVLDGITAGVIGLVAATAMPLAAAALTTIPAIAIFGSALFTLYVWRAGIALAVVVVSAGVAGLFLFGS
jgi:chromate transporter